MFRETICSLCLPAFSLPFLTFPYLQGTAVRYRILTVVLHIAVCWFFQSGEMRSQESNYMYSSFTKSTIKNQNTQLTEKSVGITIRIFPDYPIEKSQYPINKKNQWVLPNSPKFLIWSSASMLSTIQLPLLLFLEKWRQGGVYWSRGVC